MFRLITSGETFVAFDTETTGLNTENCRIIEIGAVRFDQNGIIDTFNSLINPDQEIPLNITEITNINNQMVKDSPKIYQVLPKFLDFLTDSIVIGHNIQFDLRFLEAECLRNNFPVIKNTVIDTLQFSRWALPELKKYKQSIIADYFGVNIEAAHRAYDDARVCGNIFLHCIKASAQRQKVN